MDIDREMVYGVGPNGIDVREYTYDGVGVPSVTTVLKTRNDDKSALESWKERNDGVGDNADHNHLLWYSQQLGTLAHWYALKTLDPYLRWSEDEAASLWAIQHIASLDDDSTYTAADSAVGQFEVDGKTHQPVHDATPREVLYSVEQNYYGVDTHGDFYDEYGAYGSHGDYTAHLCAKLQRDIQFFVSAQQQLWDELIDSVIAVEQFLHDTETGYGGQVDLVYEDTNGYTVVADLKSSSGCYDKHQMQGAAYAKAIERSDDVAVESVDRLEVHRTHPRSGQAVAHTSETAEGLQPIHSTEWWDESYDQLWSRFETLAENFEY